MVERNEEKFPKKEGESIHEYRERLITIYLNEANLILRYEQENELQRHREIHELSKRVYWEESSAEDESELLSRVQELEALIETRKYAQQGFEAKSKIVEKKRHLTQLTS